jgi:hypothetical protein
MPAKSKDSLSDAIRALPEFQRAARSYLKTSYYQRQTVWQRLGDGCAIDCTAHHFPYFPASRLFMALSFPERSARSGTLPFRSQ